MKKFYFLMALVLLALLAGCKAPNPAGVYGGGAYGLDGMSEIPLAGREFFSGGREHREMFAPVHFAYDSSQVGPAERAKIEAVSSHLKQTGSVGLVVEGHCDERGSREYNLALGERRALAVRSYLVGLGIAAERIQTKSLGEEQPAAMGHDEASWSQNRRGEFVIYY